MNNYDDPGLKLTPRGRRVLVALTIFGFIILLAWALSSKAEAAPLTGNRGGCALGNQWPRLACVVTGFRPGYVSGTCEAGLWFRNERTARTFRLDQPVTVWGCEYEGWRISGAPGYKFRIAW